MSAKSKRARARLKRHDRGLDKVLGQQQSAKRGMGRNKIVRFWETAVTARPAIGGDNGAATTTAHRLVRLPGPTFTTLKSSDG